MAFNFGLSKETIVHSVLRCIHQTTLDALDKWRLCLDLACRGCVARRLVIAIEASRFYAGKRANPQATLTDGNKRKPTLRATKLEKGNLGFK